MVEFYCYQLDGNALMKHLSKGVNAMFFLKKVSLGDIMHTQSASADILKQYKEFELVLTANDVEE
jgi:hypothetical protein